MIIHISTEFFAIWMSVWSETSWFARNRPGNTGILTFLNVCGSISREPRGFRSNGQSHRKELGRYMNNHTLWRFWAVIYFFALFTFSPFLLWKGSNTGCAHDSYPVVCGDFGGRYWVFSRLQTFFRSGVCKGELFRPIFWPICLADVLLFKYFVSSNRRFASE